MSAQKWRVKVFVCGVYSGSYLHDTAEEAEADADERRRLFRALGCFYRVEGPIDVAKCNVELLPA